MRGMAHMCAIFLAAVVIVTGTETVLQGPVGLLSGLAKSVGGFMIWLMLGVVSAPIGLILRNIMGRLPFHPFYVAVVTGIVIGWILIPVMNPAMAPPLTFSSHPVGLLIVYSLAGGLGGLVWYVIEFRKENRANV
ncbi:hypothetical protein [Cypionkella sp.]|uniref:hypothetical protein n=1 Tax=Cypionkella sp. TaxID=2811411 RepID=UPI0026021769|nr:hypothetical protein [Cypionkella sp.]MDB5665792.1 hypothetical protein [Cypionkella sp.]